MSKGAKLKGSDIVATIVGVSTPVEVELIVDPKIARINPLEMGEFVVVE